MPVREESPELEDLYGDGDGERFNENTGSVKRRKVSGENTPSAMGNDGDLLNPDARPGEEEGKNGCTPPPPELAPIKAKKPRKSGPFLSDSECSEDEEMSEALQTIAVKAEKNELDTVISSQPEDMNEIVETKPVDQADIHENKPVVPEVESVVPIKKSKAKKKVPIAAAQAKWEALQPSSPPPVYLEESEGSAYGEVKKKGKKVKGKKESIVKKEKKEQSPVEKKPRKGKGKDVIVPNLKKEATSVDEWEKFEDFEEFPDDDDEFGEGEEAVERKWMEEQARLEAGEEMGDDAFGDFEGEEMGKTEPFNDFEGEMEDNDPFNVCGDDDTLEEAPDDQITASCPICEAALGGISPDDATRHVNGCLDGNPIPLPEPKAKLPPAMTVKTIKTVKSEPGEAKVMPAGANRFARKAAIARPGQANPFEIGSTAAAPSSAFSKLMSGHAEDAAWANAAAAENKSRGKPAYERTCPFYKIMPGFFICVDAFRYGAVQGCNGYFLSHFHSDHYIGLTSTWCHGPIYCSKVTANLVKQQLRVDPKYVVPLEFDERFDIPGTQGVAITMIPANHCPGSSLFLFEKVIGKGTTPKVQRILHCGDFRACPAHIAHPLLMPDIVDTISGKTKQQKIDVCYLDTTYLNPKYSFPSQEEVINACADMCVSLRKERAEETDAWEIVKRERAGTGMTKFVNSAIKAEDDSLAMSITPAKDAKPRGRLLVVCGTYSIGKERICMGIARALDCKIWAPPGKMRICKALEDEELMSRMTSDPREAQIHMQMLMEIRPETLQDYLNTYKPHFSRIVGFRPSGWNYRPPNSRYAFSPPK